MISGADIRHPAILKVDCEDSTLDVLKGAERLLPQFDFVHMEMLNENPEYAGTNFQPEIVKLMSAAGFNQWRIVDAYVWIRNIPFTDWVFYRR